MESIESSSFDSFKSKKILRSSSKTSSSPSDQKTRVSDQTPWDTKTPEKPINPPRRVRNRGAAMSVKEVRQAAQALRKSDPNPSNRPDPLMSSAKQHIASWPESSPVKPKKPESSVKLPEKYEILDKFFNSLDSSIRLLRLKGSTTTVTNISPKVECLTDRRFTYSHLAQLKFILPEAIELKKVLVRDERTSCMKPDLHVTLNASAVENKGKLKSDSGNGLLRKVFRARLVDFCKAHPEGDEVPEEALPEPFGHSKQDVQIKPSEVSGASLAEGTLTVTTSEAQPATASHISQSFRRHFSVQVSKHEKEKTEQDEAAISIHNPAPAAEKNRRPAAVSPLKFSAKLPPSPLLATPIKDIKFGKSEDCSSTPAASSQGTPAGLASTPAKFMSATPTLQPPKRCYMSPDDDSIRSPVKLVRRPSRSRSLKFDTPTKGTKVKDDIMDIGSSSVDADILDILPENLLASIREKEKKALMEKDPAISQAKWRQQMIAGLPKFFDTIYFLFQSIKRSVITKEELMHRIVASNLDIVDRREVEEQLRLLQELVPEWISEKLASSGDLLFRVNKIQSPESIRIRLAQAI